MFKSKKKQNIRLLYLDHYPIFKQLQLEEALLRADSHQWCLINRGTAPAIVMGISGKPEQLINASLMMQRPLPLIRRFSGGGTVVVDQHTYFVTWICNSESVGVACCPTKIMHWTAGIYKEVFLNVPFALRENDYVIGERKCGGNAQYMRKDRWLHHTSFLWDYDPAHMNYLLQPPRMPLYRQSRSHEEFLCRLRDFMPHQDDWLDQLIAILKESCDVEEASMSEVEELLDRPHRKMTTLVRA